MGSHYIPVGKIKIDKDILDIVCPAAGYGETPPPPQIYCPANGYIENPEHWEEPFEMVNPSNEEILLLVDDLGQGVISLYCKSNVGNTIFELLTPGMTVIDSKSFALNLQYTFPTFNTGTYYIIRLKPENVSSVIDRFYASNSYTGYNTNWRIYKAIFNTPNITNLSNVFKNNSYIKECIFLADMNFLTTMYYSFNNSGIQTVQWPSQMNNLTNLEYAFQNTFKIKVLNLSGISLNSLNLCRSMLQDSSVEYFVFPDTLDVAGTNLISFMNGCKFLKSITFPSSMNGVTMLTLAFQNCFSLEGELIVPNLPNATSFASMFAGCKNLSKIKFTGPSDLCTSLGSIFSNCFLEEAVLPSSLNAITSLFNMCVNGTVKKIVMPLSLTGLGTGNMNGAFSKTTETITTCNQWPANPLYANIDSVTLTQFVQPTLKASNLKVGVSYLEKCKATTVEIDWENSTFDSGTTTLSLFCELSASELNRIFNALPVVSHSPSLDARFNPGFATCDPSIAQAKGWIVTGA